MRKIWTGFRCFFQAPSLLSATRTWKWVIAPGVLLTLGIVGLVALTLTQFLDFAAWLPAVLPDWAQGAILVSLLATLLWALGIAALLFFLIQFLMIAWAPVFGFVSEKIDNHLEGAPPREFSLKNLAHDLWRALRVTLKSLALYLCFILLSLSLALIPVAGGIASFIALLLTNGYFAALGYIDSCLERRTYSIAETFDFAARHRLGLLSIGLCFSVCLMLPVIGWIIAPGLAVAACTAYCVRMEA